MSTGSSKYLAWLPVVLVAAGVIASGAVDTFKLQAHAEELVDLGESVDENEDGIEAIQRLLIERQGTVALDIQRIETEQKAQGDDLAQILRLLQQIQGDRQ